MLRLLTLLSLILLLFAPGSPALALTIAVDGQAGDWASVPGLTPDPADPINGGLDIRAVYYTNSSSFLYLRYDTTTTAVWPNTTVICFNSTSDATGNQTPSGCGTLTQVDYRLTINGAPTGNTFPNTSFTLQSCNNGGNCSNTPLSTTNIAVASAGTVTEIAIPFSAIGVVTPGLSGAFGFSINTSASAAGGDTVAYTGLSLPSPTPVTLTTLSAAREGATVRVSWETATERDVLGYQVLRSASGARAEAVAILPELLPASGDSVSGASYAAVDSDPPAGPALSYWLEVWNSDGSRDEYGPILPAGGVASAPTTLYLPLLSR